ncbi:hypothetical protein FA13DRAFT_1736354 [Coprinellus micaceus]|uniref:Uncharacterized protein n=1 Tax=Coprinellus micaceus TaxID=71717 RepID=A0A4Y7T0I6_COPMI|nr:hypothetical protein FA13DRAFT_1736354 [Coprinellus micaceus]
MSFALNHDVEQPIRRLNSSSFKPREYDQVNCLDSWEEFPCVIFDFHASLPLLGEPHSKQWANGWAGAVEEHGVERVRKSAERFKG